jgi:ankyrin repeat protein
MKRRLLITCCLGALLLAGGGYWWWCVRRDARNQTLVAAVEAGDLPSVQRLLDEGADPNACKGPPGPSNPLDYLRRLGNRAAEGSDCVFSLAVYSRLENDNRPRIAELLLERGADVPADLGAQALHRAAENGATSLTQLLLDRGVPIDVPDRSGDTALVRAVLCRRAGVAAFLVERGADPQKLLATSKAISDFEGKDARPIDLFYFEDRWNGSVVQALVRRGLPVNTRVMDGQTLPMAAVRAGDRDSVKLLLDRGADIHARDRNGRTLLMIAVIAGDGDSVKFLLDRGADIHARDCQGKTALDFTLAHLGSQSGRQDIATMLKRGGAMD